MFNQAYQDSYHIHAYLFELKLKLIVNTWLDQKKNFKNPTWLKHGWYMADIKKNSKLFVLKYTKKQIRLSYPEK